MKALAVINKTPHPDQPHDIMETYEITAARLIIKQLVKISEKVIKNPLEHCSAAQFMAHSIQEIKKHVEKQNPNYPNP